MAGPRLNFAIMYILRLKDELRRLSLLWLLILPLQLLLLVLLCIQANLLPHPDDMVSSALQNVLAP